jgi:hypothetical protein
MQNLTNKPLRCFQRRKLDLKQPAQFPRHASAGVSEAPISRI